LLEFSFADEELRSICEDAAYAEMRYGPVVAEALVGRLADLRAAEHPLESPFAETMPATGADPEHIVVRLAEERSLVVVCSHTKPPRGADGAVEWHRVYRILVVRVD